MCVTICYMHENLAILNYFSYFPLFCGKFIQICLFEMIAIIEKNGLRILSKNSVLHIVTFVGDLFFLKILVPFKALNP